MRISSTLFFQTGLNSINAQQADLMHLFQQVGSGQRMVTPADDPLAAAQAINISQAQSLNQRFAGNREVAKRNLGMEENTLNSITTLMQDVKTRLIQVGTTLSDVDRATLANVFESAKSNMLALANSTDGNGQHLFSGSYGNMAPYQANAGGDVGNQLGDGQQRIIQVDQTRQLAGSDIGADVFERAAPGTNVYLSQADGANVGTAVISTPTVLDPAGTNVGMDFEIVFTSATTYDFTVTGYDPASTSTGSGTYAGGDTHLVLPGDAVQVKFSGKPANGDTFTVKPAASPATDLNIFDTFDSVIAALNVPANGNDMAQANLRNTIASAMQRFDVNYDNVLTVRASVGARLHEIDAIDANGSMRNLGYTAQLSQLEDLDYYTATTQLELRKSALEAAALAFRKIQGTSLFNMGAG